MTVDISPTKEFIRLAKMILARLQRSTKPDWWNDVESLSYELEAARRRIGERSGLNCDFDDGPAFLIARSSRSYHGTDLVRSFDAHQLVEQFEWCWDLTTMLFCDPCTVTWHPRQYLYAIIDETAHAKACLAERKTIDPNGPSFLQPEFEQVPCRRFAPNEFRADDGARLVAIECIQQWIDAVELLDSSAASTTTETRNENPHNAATSNTTVPPKAAKVRKKRGVSIVDAAKFFATDQGSADDWTMYRQSWQKHLMPRHIEPWKRGMPKFYEPSVMAASIVQWETHQLSDEDLPNLISGLKAVAIEVPEG